VSKLPENRQLLIEATLFRAKFPARCTESMMIPPKRIAPPRLVSISDGGPVFSNS
jgi:hypothetical protein